MGISIVPGIPGRVIGGYFEAVNVQNYPYNAKGDGVTDDTLAIQRAIDVVNAAGGGTVFIPSGTYMIRGIRIPANNITLLGACAEHSYGSGARRLTILKARPGATSPLVELVLNPDAIPDVTNCRVADISIDGDLNVGYGMRLSGAHLIERVHIRGCLSAGLYCYNFTNGTRIRDCGFNDNFGLGLLVAGVSSTTFSVSNTNCHLNQAGGCRIEGGDNIEFDNCIFESNGNYGLTIYRPDTNTNEFGQMLFRNCWFEDNGNVPATIIIDAQTRDTVHAPNRITFEDCHISVPNVTYSYASLGCAKWVTFLRCNFAGSTAAAPIATNATSFQCAILNCTPSNGLTTNPITASQVESFVNNGTKCFWSDTETRRVIGAGAPSPAFQNAWGAMGGGHSVPQYWMDWQGNIHLEGHVAGGVIGLAIFTLPAGYRPSKSRYFATFSNDAFGSIEVTAAGAVNARGGSNVSFSLNGVNFSTD